MNRGQRIRAFLGRWRNEFGSVSPQQRRRDFRGEREQNTLWEGEIVYHELEKAGVLQAVMLETVGSHGLPKGWRLRLGICAIAKEVLKYAEHAGRVVQKNKEIQWTDRFLQEMACRFLSESRAVHDPEIRKVLAGHRRQFNEERLRLQERQRRIWDSPPGVLGKVLIDHGYKRRRPVREPDLDTQFQIHVAKILRLYLDTEDVPRETICRLIVLIYLVGNLAKDKGGRAIINYRNQELKLSDVSQRLRRAGIK